MTRREAYALVDRGLVTFGDLRDHLAEARKGDLSGRSRLNPALTREQSLTILTKAIADRLDTDLVLLADTASYVVRGINARNTLLATNILRECGALPTTAVDWETAFRKGEVEFT